MPNKLTNEDKQFLAKLPLSEEQMIELLKWAHTYKEEEKPTEETKEENIIYI